MARMVKHSVTKEDLDYSECYKVKITEKKNNFYIDEDDYLYHMNIKETKAKLLKSYNRLWLSMIGEFNKEDFYGPMKVAYTMLMERYPVDFLLPRMKDAFLTLDWVRDKHFSNGKQKLTYLLKVLTSELEDDIISYRSLQTYTRANQIVIDNNILDLSQREVVRQDINDISMFIKK